MLGASEKTTAGAPFTVACACSDTYTDHEMGSDEDVMRM